LKMAGGSGEPNNGKEGCLANAASSPAEVG